MRKILLALVSITILALIFGTMGCSSTPNETTAPATTAATTVPVTTTPGGVTYKPVVLRSNYAQPPGRSTIGYEWWATQVTARTNGAVTFRHFYSEALGATMTSLTDLKNAAYDLTAAPIAYWPAEFPLNQAAFMPGITGDYEVMGKACNDLLAIPEVEAEYTKAGVKLLAYFGGASNETMSVKPIRTLADLKGVRIRASGFLAKQLAANGATVVSMPTAEMYDALQKKVIDAATTTWPSGFTVYSVQDTCKYATIMDTGANGVSVLMSLATFNKMEPAVQKIMLEEAAKMPAKYVEVVKAEADKALVTMKTANVEIINWSTEDKAKFNEYAKTAWDSFVTTNEKAGLPGQKVLDTLKASVAKYSKP